jgi:formylglycine-generating enzyme required for sulfatase activity
MNRRAVVAALFVAAIAACVIGFSARARMDRTQCGPGFVARGARCLAPEGTCPSPLVATSRGCDAPSTRVVVRAGALVVGSSDWEAEGKVAPRTIHVPPFAIDAFEITVGAYDPTAKEDLARAASGMTRADAERFCASRGGRLPSEDEWIAAAAGPEGPARRYPWGDTGAVCRRAAWGLTEGPCARGADGPDTVGAHPSGDTPNGIHDLAGNVAEWVAGPAGAKGGSFRSALATDLRTWARATADPATGGPEIGFRCAYDPP